MRVQSQHQKLERELEKSQVSERGERTRPARSIIQPTNRSDLPLQPYRMNRRLLFSGKARRHIHPYDSHTPRSHLFDVTPEQLLFQFIFHRVVRSEVSLKFKSRDITVIEKRKLVLDGVFSGYGQ